jgi:hypothetical protein
VLDFFCRNKNWLGALKWPQKDQKYSFYQRLKDINVKVEQSFFNFVFIKTTTLCIPWRDSISRPIAPISSVAGGDVTTRPRRQGSNTVVTFKLATSTYDLYLHWRRKMP